MMEMSQPPNPQSATQLRYCHVCYQLIYGPNILSFLLDQVGWLDELEIRLNSPKIATFGAGTEFCSLGIFLLFKFSVFGSGVSRYVIFNCFNILKMQM